MTQVPLQVQFDPASARFGASRSQKRLEDDRLLAGQGLFSDDRVLPRQAWLVLVRSAHAHARIASIDLSEAKKRGGTIAAWCMADLRADGVKHIPFPPLFKRADGTPMAAPLRTPLAEDKVFYVGQPLAAIVAETREQAQDAAELVAVEYEDLPCVVDPRKAIAPGAPLLWEAASGNIAAEARYGDAAAVDKVPRRGARLPDSAA
jgi:carbon-monoxide dehydrogenase large subunit